MLNEPTMDQLRKLKLTAMAAYNYDRPHQALGWRTPAEQRAINLGYDAVAA